MFSLKHVFTGDFSDEHGERFHQEISFIENRYRGKDSPNLMLGAYIDSIIYKKSDVNQARKTYVKRFTI